MKVSNNAFVQQASNGGYIGIPYEKLDCQAFVEKVLADCGVKRNWRGSNDMWRNAVHNQTALSGNNPPPGAWLFTIRHDGKEDKNRYKDGINAAHLGIYIGDGVVIHSTRGGVQWDKINSSRWTHFALANDIDYNSDYISDHDMLVAIYNKIVKGE